MQSPATPFSGYTYLPGAVPVVHAPEAGEQAEEVRDFLETGVAALSGVFGVEPPELRAMLICDEDWGEAPRESARSYPPGLPYFTRSVRPPTLVLPVVLSPAFRPRTEATYPLVVWHELAHAFLLRGEVARTPVWLGELAPQAAAATVAHRTGLLSRHLDEISPEPGFTVRGLKGHAEAETQMAFQNLLLLLGAAAIEEFGESFLYRLAHALWRETDVVDEGRAEALLADSLGPGGREWLESRQEF